MAYDYRELDAVPLASVDLTSGERSLVTAVVTPLDAARLLETNRNRRINENTVARYARMMQGGEWDWCDGDDPLKFGPGGVLRNGQHRLTAQVRANVTGAYDLRTGVHEEAYKVMDSGRSRVVADYFYGRRDARNVSATANVVVAARRGFYGAKGSAIGNQPSRIEAIGFAEGHYDELQRYVNLANRLRKQNGRGSIAAYAAALYIDETPYEGADQFVDAYVRGDDGTATTKATVLKKLAQREFRPWNAWFGGVALMALDAWREGRGIKVLRHQDVVRRYRRAVEAFAEGDGD